MTADEVIRRLKHYRDELSGVEQRYVKSRHGDCTLSMTIGRTCIAFLLELRDLFKDIQLIREGREIVGIYEHGITNVAKVSSLHCVGDMKQYLSAAITRITHNPGVVNAANDTNQPSATAQQGDENGRSSAQEEAMAIPEKVTLQWLWEHVPITVWLTCAGVLIAVFMAGATVEAKAPWFRDLVGTVMTCTGQGTEVGRPAISLQENAIKKN